MKEETNTKRKPEYQTADGAVYGLLKTFAQQNRQSQTDAEHILWQLLKGRQLGVTFRRQQVIGQFIADFACLACHLVIEVDGGYHQMPDQQSSDAQRTEWLQAQGYTVIRFTNEAVIGDTSQVLSDIKHKISELTK